MRIRYALTAALAASFTTTAGFYAIGQGVQRQMTPGEAAVSRLPPGQPATSLRTAASFAIIPSASDRSLAMFQEIGKVLQHPRCLNCHPATERPTQTDAMRPHEPVVVRGEGGMGAPGMACTTCHGPANYEEAKMPGDPQWHLAPIEMAWQDRTLGQICEQIKDTKRNGGKDMAALIKHMAEDSLVGWGWRPGGDRTPVPGTQAQFGELFKAWADSGALCPTP